MASASTQCGTRYKQFIFMLDVNIFPQLQNDDWNH